MARRNPSLSCVALLGLALLALSARTASAQQVRDIPVLDTSVSPYYFSPPVRGTATFSAHLQVGLDIPGIVRGNSAAHAQDGSQLVLDTVVDILAPDGGVLKEVVGEQTIAPLDRDPGGGQHSIVVAGSVTWNGNDANGVRVPDAIYTFRMTATLRRVTQNLNSNGQSGQPRVTLLAQTMTPAQSRILVDSTPPVVGIDYPLTFALLRTGSFAVQAHYSDNLAGVDTGTAQVLVNAVDLTSFANIAVSTLSVNLVGGLSLPDGAGSAQVLVKDRAGNLGTAVVQFLVDTIPPAVQISPSDGSTITSFPVTFQVNITDSGSGLVELPATIKMNGIDVTSRFQAQVPSRMQVLNLPGVAQEVDYSYTPSVDDF